MGVHVVFDYDQWIVAFPQFATAPGETPVTSVCLPIAEQYCRNDGGGPVQSIELQTQMLNLMVAHVCQLLYGPNGNNPSGIVGRITNASEGSVSVGSDFPVTQATAWFAQTTFGAMFLQLAAPFRTMRYAPGPRRNFNPWPYA